MRSKSSFDEKCLDLAKYFTEEPAGKWTKEDVNELAKLIQLTIEEFLCEDEPPLALFRECQTLPRGQ